MQRVAFLLAQAMIILFVASPPFATAQPNPATQPAKVQPVDFEKLKALMPERAVGVARSSNDGDKQEVGDWVMTRARAEYMKPDSDGTDPHASIEITDFGAAPQLVAGMTAWRTVPMNIENADGYQRTLKYKDYPALQTYAKEGDTRTMLLLVNERFLVQVESWHVKEADFKSLIDSLPLDELKSLQSAKH